MEKTAYIGLGANIGDTRANMRHAVRTLANRCKVTAVSSLYLTKPVGLADQPDFHNAVVEVRTDLCPHDMLSVCQSIEQELGRQRTLRWGPRVIDVDILAYEGVSMRETELELPHPRMLERAFVLVPLAEIAPDLILSDGRSAREAAQRIDKTGVVRIADASWSDNGSIQI